MKLPLACLLIFVSIQSFCQRSIDTTQTFFINEIKQFVSIKGKDVRNPVLLFLHGGPGSSAMSYGDKFTYKLQQNFTVVQWDQRQTGRTLALNPSNVPLTFELFQNDTNSLIDSLLQKFNHKRLYLMGHSWGTSLGFYIAGKYPDKLYAYIPVCPMIDQLESERIVLDSMKAKALKSRNTKALNELNTVKIPFENGKQLYYHRKWLLDYHKSKSDIQKSYVETWAGTWLAVYNEASTVNLIERVPELKCPVYFMLGRNDYQTNSSIASKYYETLTANKKGLYWFENSTHFVPTTEPYKLQNIIIDTILPETFFATEPTTVQTTD